MSGQFEAIAQIVVERLFEILEAHSFVLNAQNTVVATSQTIYLGSSLSKIRRQIGKAALPIPIQVADQQGQLIVSQSPAREAISPRLVHGLMSLIVHQATTEAQIPNQSELKHKFIHDLLRGSSLDEVEILRDAQILGMDLSRPRAVLLIDASEYILASATLYPFEKADTEVGRRVQFVINTIVSFFSLPNDTICAYIGNGEVVVLKASGTQDLEMWTNCETSAYQTSPSWANLTALKRAGAALLHRLQQDTQTPISIGIGRHHPSVRGLAYSYQDARAALSLGRRFHGQNQVHCLDQLGIIAFMGVSDEGTKVDLANHLLSPLNQEIELLQTLDMFFAENCCPSSTANRLSIHRNTLSYRLEKITSLTGLDPRRFDDAMQIRLALFLRSLQDESPELCNCTRDQPRTSLSIMRSPDAFRH